jgi:Rrf2 family protein
VRVTARVDYAVRAAVELAAAGDDPVKRDLLAASQDIPVKFLEAILGDLRRAGLVVGLRGSEGGYRLAVPAEKVSVADIIRAVEGPMAHVRGQAPEDLEYPGAASALRPVWLAVRASLRAVLEEVSIADIAGDDLPPVVAELLADPEAWRRR